MGNSNDIRWLAFKLFLPKCCKYCEESNITFKILLTSVWWTNIPSRHCLISFDIEWKCKNHFFYYQTTNMIVTNGSPPIIQSIYILHKEENWNLKVAKTTENDAIYLNKILKK